MISEDTIKEFKEIVQRNYGRGISFEDASEILYDLTDYFYTLYLIDRETDSGML